MRTKIIFVCETCGKESENRDDIFSCEASHLGLTVDEAREWERLKSFVANRSHTVAWTRNQATVDAFDEAVDELTSFEVSHGLIKD